MVPSCAIIIYIGKTFSFSHGWSTFRIDKSTSRYCMNLKHMILNYCIFNIKPISQRVLVLTQYWKDCHRIKPYKTDANSVLVKWYNCVLCPNTSYFVYKNTFYQQTPMGWQWACRSLQFCSMCMWRTLGTSFS